MHACKGLFAAQLLEAALDLEFHFGFRDLRGAVFYGLRSVGRVSYQKRSADGFV